MPGNWYPVARRHKAGGSKGCMKKSTVSAQTVPAPVTARNEIVVYQPDETTRLDVRLEEDTVWLTQGQMTDLFERDRTVITRHINNVFAEGELDEKRNVHFLHIPFSDKPVKVYSLNVIISVGYRVKSLRGTQFRIWATNVLREYLLRGYAFNQRLNQLEDKVDRRMAKTEADVVELKDKVDFFVQTSMPPVRGVFYNDQGKCCQCGNVASCQVQFPMKGAA